MSDQERVYRQSFMPDGRFGVKAAAMSFAAAALVCGATLLANMASEHMTALTQTWAANRRAKASAKRKQEFDALNTEVQLWQQIATRRKNAESSSERAEAAEELALVESIMQHRRDAA